MSTEDTYDRMVAYRVPRKPVFWGERCVGFIRSLPTLSVLDVGCGTGIDAEIFLAHGVAYVGIDTSSATIDVAKKQYPRAEFRVADVRTMVLKENSLGGIWAVCSLLHVTYEEIDYTLQRLSAALVPQGRAFIVMREGHGTGIVQSSYGDRHFTYYQHDEFAARLKNNGFGILNSEIDPRGIMGSHKSKFLIYDCRKA